MFDLSRSNSFSRVSFEKLVTTAVWISGLRRIRSCKRGAEKIRQVVGSITVLGTIWRAKHLFSMDVT